MQIGKTKQVPKAKIAQAQAVLDAGRKMNAEAMKDLRAQRKAVGAKKGEGRVGGWHMSAVVNAIQKYGPEVMTPAAGKFWEEQKRLYPDQCADETIPGHESINGHVDKFGKVETRCRYQNGRAIYEVWLDGAWVEITREEFMKKKGNRL